MNLQETLCRPAEEVAQFELSLREARQWKKH